MADLDDFFAKKDKKKLKVKKFTTSEMLTPKVLDDSVSVVAPVAAVRKPAPERKKEVQDGVDENGGTKVKEGGEETEEGWADEFEQEKERDYSGLKIQKLQIQDSEEEEGQYANESELNEEGEMVKRGPSGPWNKLTSQPAPNVKGKEPAPVENLPNTTGGVYIPPSKRMQGAGGGGGGSSAGRGGGRSGKKTSGAPDLSNEEFFPSLSAAQAIEEKNFKLKKFDQQERGFIEAKPSRSHSSRTAHGDDGPRINLGNKYGALSNDDS